MRIEQLKALLEISKKHSYNKASEALYLTPQSLSRSIDRMEKELGFRLFHRSPSGVHFTEEGEIFLKSARKIVQEYERALRTIQKEQERISDISGDLLLYANPFFHEGILSSVLQDFYIDHPNIRVTAIERDPVSVYQLLQQAEREARTANCLGLVVMPEDGQDFFPGLGKENSIRFQTLKRAPYYVYVKQDSPLAKKKCLPMKEVPRQPVVLFSSTEKNITPLRFSLEKYGKLKIVFTTSSLKLWFNAINEGIGIGFFQDFLPYFGGQYKSELESIAKIPLEESIYAELGYLYYGELTPITELFLRYVQAAIA